jgi:L-fuculose-phosphate aldolase
MACLLGHHGLIVLADNFARALWLAIEVEALAKMYVHALAIGEPRCLSEQDMLQVFEQIRRMSYGKAPDLDGVIDAPRQRQLKVPGKKRGSARRNPAGRPGPSQDSIHEN